jgi:hypothetical protein
VTAPTDSFCPTCTESFGQGATACPHDGTPLIVVNPADPLVGADIDGRFTIVSRLGAGGMGAVYRATQHSVARDVALKVLHVRHTGTLDAAKRFVREARLASRVSHPHTVTVLDFGQTRHRRALPRHGVPAGPRPPRRPTRSRRLLRGPRRPRRRPDQRCARRRPPPGHHPPRPQAVERRLHPRAARPRPAQGRRLRPRQVALRRRDDAHRRKRRLRDSRLHAARGGRRPDSDAPVRPLLAGRDALRDAERAPALRQRQRPEPDGQARHGPAPAARRPVPTGPGGAGHAPASEAPRGPPPERRHRARSPPGGDERLV